MSLNEIKIPKNMTNQKEELESKNLDHLGIIAGIIDEIGIVEKINEIFLVDIREKVEKIGVAESRYENKNLII
jgi:hypothetical protein